MIFELSPAHGWVAAAVAGSFAVHHIYMAVGISKARRKYQVKYPALYADPATNKDAEAFNCVQRGHQNSLENLSAFNTLLLVAGLRYPISASIAAAVYLVGRIAYFKGYCSGDPKKRQNGGFLHLGSLALLGMCVRFAFELITSRP